jgi:hypothetical protein
MHCAARFPIPMRVDWLPTRKGEYGITWPRSLAAEIGGGALRMSMKRPATDAIH